MFMENSVFLRLFPIFHVGKIFPFVYAFCESQVKCKMNEHWEKGRKLSMKASESFEYSTTPRHAQVGKKSRFLSGKSVMTYRIFSIFPQIEMKVTISIN